MGEIVKTSKVYIKNGHSVLVSSNNLFVYETSVYAYHKRYCSLCNSGYFSSSQEIQGVVDSFFKTPHIQLCTELFSAPEQWLIDNEYIVYSKPTKIVKNKNIKKADNAGQKIVTSKS